MPDDARSENTHQYGNAANMKSFGVLFIIHILPLIIMITVSAQNRSVCLLFSLNRGVVAVVGGCWKYKTVNLYSVVFIDEEVGVPKLGGPNRVAIK